jgi:hypothetical protein
VQLQVAQQQLVRQLACRNASARSQHIVAAIRHNGDLAASVYHFHQAAAVLQAAAWHMFEPFKV